MNRVFVYGTLMKGYSNHQGILSGCSFIGKGELEGYRLYNLGWYPGIVPMAGEATKGEVYQVDEPVISKMDRLEGEGSLYIRKNVKILLESGQSVDTYVYVWNGSVDSKRKVEFCDQPWKPTK